MIQRQSCPNCQGHHWTKLYQEQFLEGKVFQFLKNYYGAVKDFTLLGQHSYTVNQCQQCLLLWQEEILDDEGMKTLYEEWINAEKSLAKREENNLSYFKGLAREIELTTSFFNAKPKAIRALDFGMGWGHWVIMARAYGLEVYGMELSEKRIAYAQNKGIQILPYKNQVQFDYINLDQVLEHVPDPHQILSYLSAKLKPGGLLKIAVPDQKKLAKEMTQADWKPNKNGVHPLEHINCFTRESLLMICQKYQLKVISPWRFFSLSTLTNLNPFYLIKRCLKHLFTTTVYFEKVS